MLKPLNSVGAAEIQRHMKTFLSFFFFFFPWKSPEELKLNGEPLQISRDKRERGSRDRTRASGEPDANQDARAPSLIDM